MKATRKLSRRSFLGRVAGGAIAGGGALAALSVGAAAHPVTDNDPSDEPGSGTGTGARPYSDVDEGEAGDPAGQAGRLGHYSDSDSGPNGDPVNHGRQITDADPTDPPGYRPNITDRDVGPHADQVGMGRRPPRR